MSLTGDRDLRGDGGPVGKHLFADIGQFDRAKQFLADFLGSRADAFLLYPLMLQKWTFVSSGPYGRSTRPESGIGGDNRDGLEWTGAASRHGLFPHFFKRQFEE